MNIKKLNEELERILENKKTYCINLYNAEGGKELDFISRIEGFNTKEEAENFAKNKYGNRIDVEYTIEEQEL